MAARKGSENLKPPIRSSDEARKMGKKGGIASGEARRRKKTLRELLELAMERPVGAATTAEAITVALLEKALNGDVKAYEVVRDTLGENPKVKQEISGPDGGPVEHKVSPAISCLLDSLAEGKKKK